MSTRVNHFEIIVAEGNNHVFATDPRSLADVTEYGREKALGLVKRLRVAFPAATIHLIEWNTSGRFVRSEDTSVPGEKAATQKETE